MIPSDLAARLRLMTEAAVQPLASVRGVPADLPDFRSGNRFTATIQSALPDGTFKAVVAGKTVTLAMPQSAKAGDTLELVVIDRTPKAIVAARADAPPSQAAPSASPSATLSRGAQVIGTLLAQADDATGKAASLARNQPILPQPPSSGRTLAPLLQTAIAESGVFYEAHQALWVTGKLPQTALLREPQGQYSSAKTALTSGEQPPANTTNANAPSSAQSTPPTAISSLAILVRATDGELLLQSPPTNATGKPDTPSLPAEIATVVRQQLDALSNDHVLWQGQIWPGQNMEWEIENAARERPADDPQESQTWTTTLRLSLPHLGTVAANIKLDGTGVSLGLRAAQHSSVTTLRDGVAALAGALDAAGVPLRGLKVEHGEGV